MCPKENDQFRVNGGSTNTMIPIPRNVFEFPINGSHSLCRWFSFAKSIVLLNRVGLIFDPGKYPHSGGFPIFCPLLAHALSNKTSLFNPKFVILKKKLSCILFAKLTDLIYAFRSNIYFISNTLVP